MADNAIKYGFRWVRSLSGSPHPTPIEMIVATGETFDVNSGASNCDLGAGDLVRIKSTGGIEQADGTEDTAEAVFGVVVGVLPYWDGEVMKPSKVLPDNVAWGTNLERQSKVLVVPVEGNIWSAMVDDTTTATSKSAYQAFIGENVDHILTGATGETRLNPKLDISTHATTSTLFWRIVGLDPTVENLDFSEDNVRLLVEPNTAQRPSHGSLTGV